VKRHRTDDPSDVIVVRPKKRRAEEEKEDSGEGNNVKIMKLAGTVGADKKTMGEAVTKILAKKNTPNFSELKEKYKSRVSSDSPVVKVRAEAREARGEGRYRIVNQRRAINIENLEEWPETEEEESGKGEGGGESKDLFHLIDVVNLKGEGKVKEKEEKVMCNGVEMVREYVDTKAKEDEYGFVYDLYYTDEQEQTGDFDDSLLDELISIQPFNSGDDSLLFDEYKDDPSNYRHEDDADDSNDEDNWRNEYPDDDEDENSYRDYCDDDDLDFRIRNMKVGDDSEELSSDEDDQLLYTKTFEEDAAHHGASYARFKQMMMKEFAEDSDEPLDY